LKLATIELVTAVTPHSNADALDFVHVLGYDCIVSRGSFAAGDRVVLIQPDTVLPNDRAWCAETLKYTSKGRVKAARLRGQWSMGLVMPLSILPDCIRLAPFDAEGCEVSGDLGITKYEPPLPQNQDAKGGLPFGIPKTDEDRWQNIRDLGDLEGELVDVTLKIDGSSFTAFCVLPADSGQEEVAVGICSRSLEMKMDEGATNQWLEAARMTNVVAKLRDYCLFHGVSLALRGEVYGTGIQSMAVNPHSRKPRGVAFFSVWNVRERRYEGPSDPHYLFNVCEALCLPNVPVMHRDAPLTADLIRRYDSELEAINGEPFEGVVVRGKFGSFKVVNKHYDSKK
jgi:RNA ligase (TIGR02306 family)